MPLDKIEDTEEYAKTHESLILHIKNQVSSLRVLLCVF